MFTASCAGLWLTKPIRCGTTFAAILFVSVESLKPASTVLTCPIPTVGMMASRPAQVTELGGKGSGIKGQTTTAAGLSEYLGSSLFKPPETLKLSLVSMSAMALGGAIYTPIVWMPVCYGNEGSRAFAIGTNTRFHFLPFQLNSTFMPASGTANVGRMLRCDESFAAYHANRCVAISPCVSGTVARTVGRIPTAGHEALAASGADKRTIWPSLKSALFAPSSSVALGEDMASLAVSASRSAQPELLLREVSCIHLIRARNVTYTRKI